MIIGCVLYHIEFTIQTDPDVWRDANCAIALSIIGPPLGGLPTIAMALSAVSRGVADPLSPQLHLSAQELKREYP